MTDFTSALYLGLRPACTRLHCSPPSVASVRAAQSALGVSAHAGGPWRTRLLGLVQRLRTAVVRAGFNAVGPLRFPMQSFAPREAAGPAALVRLLRHLAEGGVQALLTLGCGSAQPRLSYPVTARHRADHIDHVAALLARG